MAKHNVVCKECGRTFDANKGGYYFKAERRYMCKSCAAKLKADEREARTGVRQSTGAMVAKIGGGLLFISSGLGLATAGEILTGLVIGGALIAWAVIPILKAKKDKKLAAEKAAAAIEIASQRKKLCPHCGATTQGEVCEYCNSEL